jgi:hypothetical protein
MNRKMFLLFFSCLCLFVFAAQSFGMQEQSFRIKGLSTELGGIVTDEYTDIFLNPANIADFKGLSLFTNLSNYQGSGSSSFLNQSDLSLDTFSPNIIGFFTNVGNNLGVGLLYENGHAKIKATASTTDATTDTSAALDTGYDTYGIAALGGYKISSTLSVGALIKYGKFDIGFDYNNLTSSETTTTTHSELQEFDANYKYGGFSFDLSGKMEMGQDSLITSAEAVLGMDKQAYPFDLFKFNKLTDSIIGTSITQTLEDLNANIEVNVDTYKLAGSINLQPFTVVGKKVPGKVIFEVDKMSIPLDAKYNTEYINKTEAIGSSSWYEKISYARAVSGSVDSWGIKAGWGTQMNITDSTMLAAALKFNAIWGGISGKITPETINKTYDLYDTAGNIVNSSSYTYNYTSNDVISVTGNAYVLYLNMPVGIETKLGDKFTVRLGANSTFGIYANASITANTKPGLWSETYSYLDGHTVTNSESATTTASNSAASIAPEVSISLSSYNFGASYNVTDDIRLDITHFANLTNLNTWLFSVVIKFGAEQKNAVKQ